MQLLNENNSTARDSIVLGVDVGTTNIKCYAYDRFSNVVGKACEKLEIYYPSNGKVEILPDILWQSFQNVVNNCLIASHLQANEVTCMGISTHRATFITWNKETGQPYHNFISWKDKRADDICKKLNASLLIKFIKMVCFLSYVLTRSTKFQVFSALKFQSIMVLMRLYWVLEHYPQMRNLGNSGEVLFGTIDTWLVWKLNGGKVHATDTSNACVTGFFDPFQMNWIDWILKYFEIPKHILPVVKNTSDSFGETMPHIFGSSIPICSVVGDQQASAFGSCCFNKYDINCTMGTGSFLTINTGDKLSTSHYGFFPLVGWTIRAKTTFIAECGIHETGPFVSWMQNLGWFQDPSESGYMAQSISDSGGLYFLPAHNLQENSQAGSFDTLFFGLKASTSKEHIVRSVLESLAFQVCLIFDVVQKLYRRRQNMNIIKMCGGVAKNDFVVQLISNVTSASLHRSKHSDISSLGAAYLAGLYVGVWKTTDDLVELQKDFDVFIPEFTSNSSSAFKKWKTILKRKIC